MNAPSTGALRARMQNMFDLDGKVAVVTGAGRGLGRAIALGLAGFGAEVVACGRTPATLETLVKEIEDGGGKAWWQTVDVSREDDVLALADALRNRGTDGIDILVNNAGINPIYRKPERTSLEDWSSIVDTNLTGLFLCCRHLGAIMVERGRGSIINITSVGGHVALAKSLPYCAAKGGVELATRALAIDWATSGVRVNSIAPAFFATDLTAGLRDHAEHAQRLLDQTPLGRFGDPQDLVGAAVYLASDASSYVTGHSLVVDGGWTAR